MLGEKDIRLTINNIWTEIKQIDVSRNINAVNFVFMRTTQMIALMKIIDVKDIFSRTEIESIGKLEKLYKQIKPTIPEPELPKQQLSLSDIPNEELQQFVKEFNERKTKKLTTKDLKKLSKLKTKEDNNIQILEPKERI